MKAQFTTDDYLQAIQREQQKRATTYPKIIQKMRKHGAELIEVVTRQRKMNYQNELLNAVWWILNGYQEEYTQVQKNDILLELIREFKMRKSYYPRLIYLDRHRKRPRMTQETADYELAVWESLTRWFANILT